MSTRADKSRTVQISHTKNEESIITLEPIEIPYLKQGDQESPLVIHFPIPFTYDSTKVIPWNYGATTYIGDKSLVLEPNVTNIADIGGMTRSGRVFSPKQSQKNIPDTSKVKNVLSSNAESKPSKKIVPQEEADEFINIIKKSDYKVVDKLSKTPSNISMLSLLLSSEAHI